MNAPASQAIPVERGGPTASAGATAGPRAAGWAVPLALVLLTAVGAVLRLVVAHQSLFGDELSTYWIITHHGGRGVLSTVHSDAEITPPLYFVLGWATTQFGHAPELVRAPSLVAGIASIPLMYALGLRTVGRRAALTATALMAVAPFPLYYSTEARAYGLMMALVIASTLALLLAVDTRKLRWWALYAVCSAGAMYAHYTCAFVLAVQALWVLWAHPVVRRQVILANVGAALLFAPWISGLLADFRSPTTKILSALAPFTPHEVRASLEHWAYGYPIHTDLLGSDLPGTPALIMLAVALALGIAGLAARLGRGASGAAPARLDRRIVLVVGLALALPVGTVVVSAVGTNLVSARNLAASWPGLALLLAAVLAAAPARLRLVAPVLAVAAFAVGGVKLLTDPFQRPDVRGAADLIERDGGPRPVVLDQTGFLSPGPLSALDPFLEKPGPIVIRSEAPAERDHPFTIADPVVTISQAFAQAGAAAAGRPIWVVGNRFPNSALLKLGAAKLKAARSSVHVPAGYRVVRRQSWPGVVETQLTEYARRP